MINFILHGLHFCCVIFPVWWCFWDYVRLKWTLWSENFSTVSMWVQSSGFSGYVTAAAWSAYQSFQLSLLLSIPPSAINIGPSSSYPVLNLSTRCFSWSVWTLGTTVWVISVRLIFDVESWRKQGRASSRKGFLQAQTSTTSRILHS